MAQRKRKIISVEQFHASTSSFREEEELSLKIQIQPTSKIEDIFYLEHQNISIRNNLEELILPDFNEGRIRSFNPSKDDGLTTNQRKFLLKLRLVLINNDPDLGASRCERFIDDLIIFLCDRTGLDDGLELTIRPCNLYLGIGSETFAAIADKEGRRGIELTFLIQEDKHRKSSTYKHGDLQLASAIIAATQQNYNMLEEIYPPKIIGIKLVADTVYFCAMTPTKDYIDELADGLPTKTCVTMHKYPKAGLSLSNPDQRKKILEHFSSLYSEAITIEPRT